jgi:iron complex transport system substrate-binding protein
LIRLLALLLLLAGPAQARRVVSLNLCADQYLLLLAPEQAAGVTFLAADPTLSALSAQAAGVKVVHADAESVLLLAPDLVLAGNWGAGPALAALERRGVKVLRLAPADDFAAIRARTRQAAAVLGVPARGEAAVAAMDAVLASVPARAPRPALALQPRGWTSGAGSLMRAVMAAAGLRDLGDGARLGLEALAAHPPPLLVVPEAPSYPSLATEMLAHPVLAGIPRRAVPPALTLCGGPWTAAAVGLLAQ